MAFTRPSRTKSNSSQRRIQTFCTGLKEEFKVLPSRQCLSENFSNGLPTAIYFTFTGEAENRGQPFYRLLQSVVNVKESNKRRWKSNKIKIISEVTDRDCKQRLKTATCYFNRKIKYENQDKLQVNFDRSI